MTDYDDQIDDIEQDVADAEAEYHLATVPYAKVKPFPPGPKTHWGKGDSFLDAARIKLEELRKSLKPPEPPPPSSGGGRARFYQHADSACDAWYGSATQAQKDAMNAHYALVTGWSPWHEARLSWLTGPKSIAYMDAYAIYVGSTTAAQHPEWILRDASGGMVKFYSSVQYAADISNPAYRADYVSRARALVAKGWDGIFVDDCNVTPSFTTQPVTIDLSKWPTYMADFMGELRAGIPGAFIVQNTPWFQAGGNTGQLHPEWQRMIGYADAVDMERGFNDTNIGGGTGSSSVFSALRWIDAVHALGAGVIVQSQAEPRGEADLAYNLAATFLTSNGRDFVGSTRSRTNDWWPGYDVDLGEPLGDRVRSGDVYTRAFSKGQVRLDAAARTGTITTT